MAKILLVELLYLPKTINVGDDINDITVMTKVQFHPMDLQLQMPYCLHLFVYAVHGQVDPPLIIPNWDESQVLPITLDRKDDFLSRETVMLVPVQEVMVIETPMALHLGRLNREMSYTSRKIEVFATMAPIVGRASKYSEPFTAKLTY